MSKTLLLTTFMLASVSTQVKAAEHWTRLTTPHFEMYTTNSEKQGTNALSVFEQVRYFFLQNGHSKTAPDAPVRVIAFRSEKEFKPYRTNEGSFAYYLRSRKMDYIVMQDLSSASHQAAVHEYTHLVVEHLGLKFPVWLNEGLADLYSSLEPKGNQALVGRPLEGRVGVLLTQRWLDLNTLFAVNQESPYYNERDKMSIFYAESWALTHMLELSKDYMPGNHAFLAAIAAGRPAADCFQTVYGKSVAQVTQDLHSYLSQRTVQGVVFDVKLSKHDQDPEVSEPDSFDVDLALADLLASQRNTMGEASSRLSQLAQEHPESADIQESLGYLAWEQGDPVKARNYFKLASENGSKDPEMLFHYSQLLHDSGAPMDEIIAVLQRVVTLKPDYQDAWLDLGFIAMNSRKANVALDAFSHITKVSEEQAFSLFSAQAYCYAQLKATVPARTLAEKAKQYAKTPDQQLQVSNLLGYLETPIEKPEVTGAEPAAAALTAGTATPATDKPTLMSKENRERPRDFQTLRWPADVQHVDGVAKSFECGKSPRLHVMVNSQEKVFELQDPERVVVRHGTDGTADMQCGAQKPFAVSIFYAPPPPGSRVDGMVRELVF